MNTKKLAELRPSREHEVLAIKTLHGTAWLVATLFSLGGIALALALSNQITVYSLLIMVTGVVSGIVAWALLISFAAISKSLAILREEHLVASPSAQRREELE